MPVREDVHIFSDCEVYPLFHKGEVLFLFIAAVKLGVHREPYQVAVSVLRYLTEKPRVYIIRKPRQAVRADAPELYRFAGRVLKPPAANAGIQAANIMTAAITKAITRAKRFALVDTVLIKTPYC